VFEKRVQRRIFGPKRDDVKGRWRKLHNEELHNLYSSPGIIRMIKSRRMRLAGHVARMGRGEEENNAYRLLVGKPEGKRPLGRPRHRWVDNIKIDLIEIGWRGIDWIDLAQDRGQWKVPVNTVMNLRVDDYHLLGNDTQKMIIIIFTAVETSNLTTFGFYKIRGSS
jgi:hypothetical protein